MDAEAKREALKLAEGLYWLGRGGREAFEALKAELATWESRDGWLGEALSWLDDLEDMAD